MADRIAGPPHTGGPRHFHQESAGQPQNYNYSIAFFVSLQLFYKRQLHVGIMIQRLNGGIGKMITIGGKEINK